MRLPFIAGNWKMFKSSGEVVAFAEEFKKLYNVTGIKVAICAPFVYLVLLKNLFSGTPIKVGAQNVHFADEGAYTGEISVAMLQDIGVDCCIVGHSERREYFGETDKTVNLKLKKLENTEITPILCVGEKGDARDKGKEVMVVDRQVKEALKGIESDSVKKLVIAYEPVWAIGTGRTATPEQAQEMCSCIRKIIANLYDYGVARDVTVQYGGSVKPDNAAEIMNQEDIDGGLIGGASLSPESFRNIIDLLGGQRHE